MTRSNWFILGMAVLAAGLGGFVEHRQHQPDTSLVGQTLPAISLPDLEGKTHALSDYRGHRGHRVLLNFWASWCGPCLDEMPALAQAQTKFGEQGSIVIGIAMDDPAKARAFLAAHPVNYPILLGQLTSPSTSLLFGDAAEVLPYSVLLDGDGRILAIQQGTLNAAQLQAWLAPTSGH